MRNTIRRSLPAVLVLLFVFGDGAAILAQRLPPSTRPPAVRPPPSSSGHSTARDRQVKAGAESRARDRRTGDGKDGGESKGGSDRGGASPPPVPGLPPDRREVPASIAERYLEKFVERAARARSLHYEAEVLILSKGTTRKVLLTYDGRRGPTGLLHHRAALREVTEIGEKPIDVFLVNEYAGEPAHGWHVGEDGKSEVYLGDPLLYRVSSALPLLLVDLLPFEPNRYKLTHHGEGRHDGQPVTYLEAKPKTGRPDVLALTAHRYSLLPLRGSASHAGKETWEFLDSEIETRDGVAAYERRKIVYPSDGDLVVIKISDRKVNHRVDPAKLDPKTFANP